MAVLSDRLAGRVAIVTGASPNIGGTLAAGLAAHGAKVCCNDLRAEVAEASAGAILSDGGEAFGHAGDVTDSDYVASLVAAVMQRWGRVDVLINNAVQFNPKGVLDMPVDQFRRQVDIIMGGAFLMTQTVAKAMIDAGVGGSIINILSTAAWQGQAGNIGYCSAKSGMINFTRSAAMELAPYGIRVNGFTPTATMPNDEALAARFTAGAAAAAKGGMDFTGQLPMGRLPNPNDYVGAIVYLASDDAAMVTGTNITVDGGALAKYWPQSPAQRKDVSS